MKVHIPPPLKELKLTKDWRVVLPYNKASETIKREFKKEASYEAYHKLVNTDNLINRPLIVEAGTIVVVHELMTYHIAHPSHPKQYKVIISIPSGQTTNNRAYGSMEVTLDSLEGMEYEINED